MYTKVNNLNLYYQKVGEGPNILLLHGWGQDVSTWWPIVDQLKADFTLWLLDLPGFGRSDRPTNGFTNRDYAQTVVDFIQDQKIDKPMLVGHSVGGRVGIKLAANYPDVLSKLILEDAAGIKPKQDGMKPVLYVLAKIAKKVIPNWFHLQDRIRVKFYQGLESDYLSAGEMKKTLTNLLDEDLTPELAKIKTTTLLLWGEDDNTRGASVQDGRSMYRLISQSRFELIENASHFPHLQNPAKFVYFLKDFCS